jgi:hypothetical protein
MIDKQSDFRGAIGAALATLGCSFVGVRQEAERDVLEYKLNGGDLNEIKSAATEAGARSVELCDGGFLVNAYREDAP